MKKRNSIYLEEKMGERALVGGWPDVVSPAKNFDCPFMQKKNPSLFPFRKYSWDQGRSQEFQMRGAKQPFGGGQKLIREII